MTVQLSQRDHDLLDALLRRVRVLSVPQIARTWYGKSDSAEQAAIRRLRQLQRYGLIKLLTAMAHPEIDLAEPLLKWSPSDQPPNLSSLARELRGRWSQPPRVVRLAYATRMANCRFGGFIGDRPPRT